jgi:hypothetical protein
MTLGQIIEWWLALAIPTLVIMCLFFYGASRLDKRKSQRLEESFNKAKDKS